MRTLTFLVPALLYASGAAAQEDKSAAETAAARALAIEGLKLARAGHCAEAIDKLERAQELYPSPVVLGRLGECHITLGRVVEGTEMLRKMLREPMPPNASPAVEQAYERAQSVLNSAKSRIASLTITVQAPSDANVTVTVDGKPVPPAVLGVEFPANPGEHIVEASAPGFFKASARVTLTSGEKETVPLELRRDPNAPPAPPAEAAAPAESASPPAPPVAASSAVAAEQPVPPPTMARDKEGSSTSTLAYVSYGVGVVGLAVGLGFGRAAMAAKDELEERCPRNECPKEAQSDLDAAKSKGTIATIGVGIGAAGLALGTILLIAGSSDSESSAEASFAERSRKNLASLRPRAAIGFGRVELGADF
ncbi:MAG: hypothetical protein DIU78_021570 [Pseudomonadota bacterium]|nr:MAG: hypothetical protein DIU78_02660 [Pseudomonadota bacterium]